MVLHNSPEGMDWSPTQPQVALPHYPNTRASARNPRGRLPLPTGSGQAGSRPAYRQPEHQPITTASYHRLATGIKSNVLWKPLETVSQTRKNLATTSRTSTYRSATNTLFGALRTQPSYAGVQKTSSFARSKRSLLGSLTEYTTAASLHVKNHFLGIASEQTTATNVGPYETKLKLTLRQPSGYNQPSSFASMSSLGFLECSVLNNSTSGTSSDPRLFTNVSFGPTGSTHSSELLRPESAHAKPVVPWEQRFNELEAGENVDVLETLHLAIPGAFPETSPAPPPPPKPFVPRRRKFDEYAAGETVETQEDRHLAIPGAWPDMTLHPTMPTELPSNYEQTMIYKFSQNVRTTYNFAAARMQWIGRCLRRQCGNQGPVAGQRGLAVMQTCRAAVAVAGSCKRRMVELVGRRSNRTQIPDGPSANPSNNQDVLAQGNDNDHPDGVPTNSSNGRNSLSNRIQNTQPCFAQKSVLNERSAPCLSYAQFRAIEEVLGSSCEIDAEVVLSGDESSVKLCEDEKKALLKDNFGFNRGLKDGSPQIEDATSTPTYDILPEYFVSSPSTAPVNKAKARLGEGESKSRPIEAARVDEEQRAEELKRYDAEAAAQLQREASSAEAARAAEEVLSLEAQWLKSMSRSVLPRDSKILESVARDWAQKVQNAMTRSLNAELATVSNGTRLSRRDFDTVLKEPYWLNDGVIAAYIQLSVDKALEQTRHGRGKIPKIHAFNSFFYKNLSTKGPETIKQWAGRAKIGGKDLKYVDTVFIPVNQGFHWTLLVVSPSKHTIEYFDSLSGSRTAPTYNVYTDNVKKWLKQEMGSEYNDTEWVVRIRNDGPQQDNQYDCGIFAITTAKLISLGYDLAGTFDASDMPAQRVRVVAELMARDWVDGEEDHPGCADQGVDDGDEEEEL